jgi:diacylglycerol kinase
MARMTRFLASLRHALDGLRYLLRTQWNARIEAGAALLALSLGWILDIRAWEWVAITIQIALVLTLEAVNTALEALCDVVTLQIRPGIKDAKDVAAGAVLIAAASSLVTGTIVFLPKLAAP